jgi:hypothetical protein
LVTDGDRQYTVTAIPIGGRRNPMAAGEVHLCIAADINEALAGKTLYSV